MVKLLVKDIRGEEVEHHQVSDAVFGVPMNRAVVHQAMVMSQANQRQGTASTKTRAEVSGGGRKPYRQKGTGRARAGTTRAPHWRKGGVAFGPHPRSYRQRMPRKMRRLAIRCVISDKVREERLTLVTGLAGHYSKTKEMAQVLQNLGVNSSALVVLGTPEPGTVRVVRNLPRVKTLAPDLLNVLDLVRYDHILMEVEAVQRVEQLWASTEVVPEGTPAEGTSGKKAKKAVQREVGETHASV